MENKNGNLITFIRLKEAIKIGDAVVIIKDVTRRGVRLCINAPKDVMILREDVGDEKQKGIKKK